MKKSFMFFLIALILLLSIAVFSGAAAEEEKYAVLIRVRDTVGNEALMPSIGVKIEDYYSGKVYYSGKTNKNGKCITMLPSGTYEVSLTSVPKGYVKASKQLSIYGSGKTITLKAQKYADLTVKVKSKATGKPVSIKVRILGYNGKIAQKTADSNGKATFTVEPGTKYSVISCDKKYTIEDCPITKTIRSGQKTSISVTAIPLYNVKIRVVNQYGKAVPNATVKVYIWDSKTDKNGYTTLSSLHYGEWNYEITATTSNGTHVAKSGSFFLKGSPGSTISKTITVNIKNLANPNLKKPGVQQTATPPKGPSKDVMK